MQTLILATLSNYPKHDKFAYLNNLDDDKPPSLILQKELMEKAQEIFRTANKATRPEKEHILKFMAGTRGLRVAMG